MTIRDKVPHIKLHCDAAAIASYSVLVGWLLCAATLRRYGCSKLTIIDLALAE